MPDATTLLKFHRLLEDNQLTKAILTIPEGPLKALTVLVERKKVQIRILVAHPFHVLKNLLGYEKLSCRGLRKNGRPAICAVHLDQPRDGQMRTCVLSTQRVPSCLKLRPESCSAMAIAPDFLALRSPNAVGIQRLLDDALFRTIIVD